MCWRACGRTARFHLGTVAFGSLLIAIVQFFRLILAYLDRRSKELQVRFVLFLFS
jgi:solute carrier family 44 (choline transporter-like protein), member 2/4/5